MRGIIGELKTGGGVTVVDMEAGLELFGRGTPSKSDVLVTVIEPSLWSIQTAMRVAELARELEIPRIVAVANKVREKVDEDWIREALTPYSVEVVASIPYDTAVSTADRTMRSLLDVDAGSEAAQAMHSLAHTLEKLAGIAAPAGVGGRRSSGGGGREDGGCPWVIDT